ncbi:hypothetical protein [Streptomyces sp. NBC_00687]|uniref:hypothetical protein n=1 Tax=Streptomyces sp. NBC_00687 TaxID=2975807 RepID=UPI002258B268|nr:hypothetical protein [Streptomyces sp. NBC_00687]MCX4912884.1 hypothetical protein [Streptomyces sp. NBC_00687]
MSGLEIRIITCDAVDDGEVCDGEYGGDPSVESLDALRREAAEEGWRRLPGDDVDYCPHHS